MKYWLVTAQNGITQFCGTIKTEKAFFTLPELSGNLNKVYNTGGKWVILFLMEITEEQFKVSNEEKN